MVKERLGPHVEAFCRLIAEILRRVIDAQGDIDKKNVSV